MASTSMSVSQEEAAFREMLRAVLMDLVALNAAHPRVMTLRASKYSRDTPFEDIYRAFLCLGPPEVQRAIGSKDEVVTKLFSLASTKRCKVDKDYGVYLGRGWPSNGGRPLGYVGQSTAKRGGIKLRTRNHNSITYRQKSKRKFLYEYLKDEDDKDKLNKLHFMVLMKVPRDALDRTLLNLAETVFILLFGLFQDRPYNELYRLLQSYGVATFRGYEGANAGVPLAGNPYKHGRMEAKSLTVEERFAHDADLRARKAARAKAYNATEAGKVVTDDFSTRRREKLREASKAVTEKGGNRRKPFTTKETDLLKKLADEQREEMGTGPSARKNLDWTKIQPSFPLRTILSLANTWNKITTGEVIRTADGWTLNDTKGHRNNRWTAKELKLLYDICSKKSGKQHDWAAMAIHFPRRNIGSMRAQWKSTLENGRVDIAAFLRSREQKEGSDVDGEEVDGEELEQELQEDPDEEFEDQSPSDLAFDSSSSEEDDEEEENGENDEEENGGGHTGEDADDTESDDGAHLPSPSDSPYLPPGDRPRLPTPVDAGARPASECDSTPPVRRRRPTTKKPVICSSSSPVLLPVDASHPASEGDSTPLFRRRTSAEAGVKRPVISRSPSPLPTPLCAGSHPAFEAHTQPSSRLPNSGKRRKTGTPPPTGGSSRPRRAAAMTARAKVARLYEDPSPSS